MERPDKYSEPSLKSCIESAKGREQKYILIYGCSGHGKSTFINYMLAENGINNVQAETSSGSYGCTRRPDLYPIDDLNIAFLDTMGNHDPEVNSTNDVNMKLIDFMMDNNVRIKKFKAIIYIYDISQVRAGHIDTYLKNLSVTLRTEITSKNVIILLTKAGVMKETKLRIAIKDFKEKLTKYPHVIPWDSMKEDEMDGQYKKLLEAISECQPTNVGFMYQIEEEINVRAKKIWEKDMVPIYYIVESDGKRTEVTADYKKIHYKDVYYDYNQEEHYVETMSKWSPLKGVIARPIGWFINAIGSGINSLFNTSLYTKIGMLEEECRKTLSIKLDKDVDYDIYKNSEILFVDVLETDGCEIISKSATREGSTINFQYKALYPENRIGYKNFVRFKIYGRIKGRKRVIEDPNLKVEYRRKFRTINDKHYSEALAQLGTESFNFYKDRHRNEVAKLAKIASFSKKLQELL